jgi:hypothetical protein
MIKLNQDEYSKYDLTEEVGDYQPMHKNMLKILKFLDGKKNILQAIVAVTATYLADKAVIGTLDAVYIVTISGIIFGTASVATTKFLYNNK